ncbi:MAG: DUF1318 domain-containing protein [bacterium]|nr:DUF1318 domain-containing protein [Gammaproteobacteria bacterium]
MLNRMICLSFLIAVCSFTQASPLDDARSAGQVVETADGYVRATDAAGSVPADIQALVNDINKRRKAAYSDIAKKNGISVAQVGAESYKRRVKPK